MPRPMSKIPATWNPGLNETERESTWKFAAGSDKTAGQHQSVRSYFTRIANEDAAEAKNGIDLTVDDIAVLEKKKYRLSNDKANSLAWRAKPGNHAKSLAWQQIPENHARKITASIVSKKKKAIHYIQSVQWISKQTELV